MFRLDDISMKTRTHRFDLRQTMRSFGLFVLVVMMLAQFIAPAVSASSAQNHDHHVQASDNMGDCPMQAARADAILDGVAPQGDTHDATAHCKLSMCCFHGAFSSSTLVAIATLLPAPRLTERGVTAASRQGGTQDRPPRLI